MEKTLFIALSVSLLPLLFILIGKMQNGSKLLGTIILKIPALIAIELYVYIVCKYLGII